MSTESDGAWVRGADLRIVGVVDEVAWIQAGAGRARARAPVGLVRAVRSLRAYQPPRVAERALGAPAGTVAQLVQAGLLESLHGTREVVVGSGGPDASAVIRDAVVVTCARPALARRCVASLRASRDAWRHDVGVRVVDDSPGDSATEDLTAPTLDRAGRLDLADALARRSGVDRETARDAVLGDRRWGFTAGAARNAAVLSAQGDAVLMVDDDETMHVVGPPGGVAGAPLLSSVADPTSFWFHDSVQDALAAHADVNEDPWQGVEALLGRSAASLVRGGASVGGLSPAAAVALGGAPGRVRAVDFGVVGDAGMGSPRHLLRAAGEWRGRLLGDDDAYAGRVRARAVLRVAPRITIARPAAFLGGAFALDLRTLLPPFPPLGRGEDALFALTLSMTDSGAMVAHLPLALRHRPPAHRAFSAADFGVRGPRLADLWVWALASRRLPPGRDVASALCDLGAHLLMLSRLSDGALEEFLRVRRFGDLVAHHAELSRLLGQPDGPVRWRDDLRCVLTAVEQALDDDGLPVPEVLAARPPGAALTGVRELLGQFGRVLQAWPALFAAARG